MRHAQPWILPFDIRLMQLTSRVLLGVVVVGSCALGFYWVMSQTYFNLWVIYVQSELEHNSPATLRLAVSSRIKGNFFTVDLDEVKSVFESAPWVRRVKEVRRVWPYGLSVNIEEYQPVALWGENRQTSYLLDEYGDVFEANAADVEEQQLPLLSAPQRHDAGMNLWQMYQKLAARLITLDERIAELHQSEQGTWEVRLESGMRIVMGRGTDDEIDQRITAFTRSLPLAMRPYGQRRLLVADLRHVNGYALQIEGVSTSGVAAQPPAQGRPAARVN